ncbi:hypothetical protein AU255_12325 [Methyloprofundus sedimenti]|uniref:Uncharacterized protein n=1 Tax=Methyloprofundus sedimenti TaxID=1420851 RepID=A0A1V8MAD6_9GAMM|nr:hypothetical protein AU255_12325 [Methyloprofundus sedimenti]
MDQWLSTLASRIRQPITILSGWIKEKTGIKCTGKVQSYKGLMVYVSRKLAAAKFLELSTHERLIYF